MSFRDLEEKILLARGSTYLITLTHDVEEEGVCVIVQRFVVQKQLCQEAQVLRVRFIFPAVYFKKWNVVFPVNFIAWRVPKITLWNVSLQAVSTLDEFEAELAEVDAG